MNLVATIQPDEALRFPPPEAYPCLLVGLLVVTLAFVLVTGLFLVIYYLYSQPMRRRERAHLFLDLIETGLNRGRNPEQTLRGVARSGDPALGEALCQLAARVESGIPFGQALLLRPWLLPPNVAALLRAGCEAGDIGTVLPACRECLRDGVAEVWKAQHYLALLAFVVTPAWVVVTAGFCVYVLPKLNAIMADIGAPPPAWLNLLAAHFAWTVGAQVLLLLGFWGLAAVYIGGPRFRDWLADHLPSLGDWLTERLPWHRLRMHRDFSAALAVLLDAGLPEARAVRLAAETAHNHRFATRASMVIDDLSEGTSLPDAVARLDRSGEFRWRLTNAAHGPGRFRTALAGWQEWLDAQAFQKEQVAAQLVTTSLVFVNGILVAWLAVGLFSMFTNLINEGVLW